METNEEMIDSLIKWLQNIVPNQSKSVNELFDGVAMMEALLQISPSDFGKLEPKIKKDAGQNWRLRVSNLKKIVEAVIEYYQDVLSLQLSEAGKPDVNRLGEMCDKVQLGKLLTLILGCAINCNRGPEYIGQFTKMEESVQRGIMTAIQQLEHNTGKPGTSMITWDNDPAKTRLVEELEATREAKERLHQQINQYEQQLQSLMEEKENLISQNRAFLEKESRGSDTRKLIENYKEELLKAEVLNDDLKAKIKEQDKQIITFQEKIAELQIAANDSSRLKDEVDALNESASKIVDLELAVQSYKKRLENYQDVKRNLQKYEEKNTEYVQRILELEEEITRNSGWKTQCDTYKNQLSDLQQKLDEEIQKSEKFQFNYESIKSKFEALQCEKERLIQERDVLREENEELKLGTVKKDYSADMAQELTPTEMKERLRFLERENKNLRTLSQENEVKQAQLDSSLSRIERLQTQNRTANQTITELEAQLEELKSQKEDSQGGSSNSIIKQKIASLQEALNVKENELQVLQKKYNRNVEKAKSMAQVFDTKTNGGIDQSFKQVQMKEFEGELLTTAFYQLGLTCQREAIDERLLNAGQGQSFLARQRQATPRKNIQRYKSK